MNSELPNGNLAGCWAGSLLALLGVKVGERKLWEYLVVSKNWVAPRFFLSLSAREGRLVLYFIADSSMQQGCRPIGLRIYMGRFSRAFSLSSIFGAVSFEGGN